MKRDWDLMGDIFNSIEKDEFEKRFMGINDEEERRRVFWHVEMLIDAGYIKGITLIPNARGIPAVRLNGPRITLQGYDFADIVKDKALLPQVIAAVEKAGLMVTWETLKAFAPKVIMSIAASAAKAVGL